jgi:hypothetical protein
MANILDAASLNSGLLACYQKIMYFKVSLDGFISEMIPTPKFFSKTVQ